MNDVPSSIRGRDILCIYATSESDDGVGIVDNENELVILYHNGEGKLCQRRYRLPLWQKELAAALARWGIDASALPRFAGDNRPGFHSEVIYPEADAGKPFYLPPARGSDEYRINLPGLSCAPTLRRALGEA